MNTEQKNERIAQFIGAKLYKNYGEYLSNTYYKMHHGRPTNDSPLTEQQIIENAEIERKAVWNPKYHTSWDWLLPAVSKFFDVEFGDHFEQWKSHCDNIKDALLSLEIDRVHQRLVEGIEWYNNQNPIAP